MKPEPQVSKKFAASVAAFIVALIARFGVNLDPEIVILVISPILSYVVTQGIADIGKEALITELAGTKQRGWLRTMFASKKFCTALAGVLVTVIAKFGFTVNTETTLVLLSPLLTFLFGQSIADIGKEAVKIENHSL